MFSKLAATIAVASVASASVSQATTSAFGKYFNYEGSLVVGGSVDQVSGDDVYVTLSGLDPDCSAGAGDAANSCGIHIHAGTDCTTNAGGHYYNTDVVSADPWSSISYTSDSADEYTGHDTVVTGYSATELTGHAYIVHDYTGARVACALLEEIGASPVQQSTEADFVTYFNYEGLLDTGGSVHVTTTGVTQEVTGSLTGIDARCDAGPSEAANSCGLHIHAGTSCDSDAGGHYWNSAMLSADPWSNVVGTPVPAYNGVPAFTSIAVGVPTGYAAEDITGHAFIVHDYTGARVACSILELDPCEGACGENTKCEQGECVADCGVANNCCVGDGNCDDANMRTCVGSFDPVCEENLWDAQCADEAKMTCGLTC